MVVQVVVAILIATVVLAVCRAVTGRRRHAARALLVATAVAGVTAAAVIGVVRALTGGPDDVPLAVIAVVAGAGSGVLVGLAAGAMRRGTGPAPVLQVCAGVVVAALAVTAGAIASPSAHASSPSPVPAHLLTPPPARPLAPWRVTTAASGRGYPGMTRFHVPSIVPAQSVPVARWRSTDAPGKGRIGSVVIPGTRSRFPARPALLYLPPAALTRTPARLPVVIAFSGQSAGAGPLNLQRPGGLESMMDRIAAEHDGVAPVVVVPDQLGPGSPNPMCVNSSLGNVATYVTQDVRSWILQHLPVSPERREWTVAGFSEGGTCAIQFGAGYPKLFGSFVDVSGELAPTNGTLAHTIAVGFHGSAAAYRAATPLQLLAAHRPFTGTRASFAVGALDRRYGAVEPMLAARAAAAGITSSLRVVPGIAHNWTIGSEGLAWGLGRLATWWGLPESGIPTGQQ